MLVSEILHSLPESLEWMVLFNLSTIRPLATDATVRRMFFLQENIELALYSHVVLTSAGPFLATREASTLINPKRNTIYSIDETEVSLFQRFSDKLDLFSVDEADCLGIGEMPPFPSVLLHIQVNSGYGEATVVFHEKPSQLHYELLKTVGVEFLGGDQEGPYYIARFRNCLPTHIRAGELAHFARTDHCNLFFLRHGSVDEELERGLIKASADRVTWAREQGRKAVSQLVNEVCHRELALTCQPPPPAIPFAFGDIVPLGFMLKALNPDTSIASIFSEVEIHKKLLKILRSKRQGLLWSYHTGCLVTSTNSVLVLQAFYDPAGVEALEIFADGLGGYYPQLWSQNKEPGKMRVAYGNQHWCQPDYATTCLVRGLRQEAGLQMKTSMEYLVSGFESRSGLYFANPYMVDWALASALTGDKSAYALKEKLAAEILASMNDDYSFGLFDVPISSAFAILSLAALGSRDRLLRMAQLRLLDFMEPEGIFPSGTPFYSTLAIKQECIPVGIAARVILGERPQQIIPVNGQLHGISFYFDSHKMISTAVAALAMSVKCSSASCDAGLISRQQSECPLRYRCRDHAEYIQRFALPPYIGPVSRKLL